MFQEALLEARDIASTTSRPFGGSVLPCQFASSAFASGGVTADVLDDATLRGKAHHRFECADFDASL